RPRPLNRTIPHEREARLIVIATEGSETEKKYFTVFRSTHVQVRVLPTEQGRSSPNHVFSSLSKFKREYELSADDQLWVMVDVDRWPKKMLAQVARGARQKGFRMAVSNPCFELWLYLHHSDIDRGKRYTSQEMKKELAELLGGYDPSDLQTEQFERHIEAALRRARALDVAPKERWPSNTGTHVYRVVNEVLQLAKRQTP
ncbi:RloB domain-containing protein, partial [Candidatus Sumerlaeota bacterium]|nr:RloB domain-containing protein [Candidatus Sumerlaeota bacterium]